MMKHGRLPIALTIAGSDSGGGAGVQADLKTFAALGVHGTSAITCITAQNPKAVLGVQACSPRIVRQQLEALLDELPPVAIKTGMLYSAPIIRAVASFLGPQKIKLVVDPVMISTSGAPLLRKEAVKALRQELLPLAMVVMPNLHEAELLSGMKLRSVEDLRGAARKLQERFGCAALVKGGHLPGLDEAVDIFYDGRQELLLQAPYIKKVSTHGTGCTYSAAVAGYMARGLALVQAVGKAKEYITQAIAHSRVAANHSVLNSFWGQFKRPVLPLGRS